MAITFDPAKRDKTLRERGIDFAAADEVFRGPQFTRLDYRRDYGEPRFQTMGMMGGRLVMLVWTPRGVDRHVISARKCNEREQKEFSNQRGEI